MLIEKREKANPYAIAVAFAYRGDSDAAFQWLERAYGQHQDGTETIKYDPNIWALKADPRFTAFLRKMKLPE